MTEHKQTDGDDTAEAEGTTTEPILRELGLVREDIYDTRNQ
jgi:hypothetical protein